MRTSHLAVTAAIDFLTGYEWVWSLLYLLPIGWSASRWGQGPGFAELPLRGSWKVGK